MLNESALKKDRSRFTYYINWIGVRSYQNADSLKTKSRQLTHSTISPYRVLYTREYNNLNVIYLASSFQKENIYCIQLYFSNITAKKCSNVWWYGVLSLVFFSVGVNLPRASWFPLLVKICHTPFPGFLVHILRNKWPTCYDEVFAPSQIY